jgi:Mob1/phocein family
VNTIIVALFSDNPPCSGQTCSEMRASEWQYLCAVHDPPKPCCAIDYCCHTLDWAANVLTSQKHFPSRMSLGPEQGASHQQLRQLTNIFRRVYRIFAHAWFQHREIFWKVEGKTGLYVFFKTVCDTYGLIPEDNYTVPPEAEGTEPATQTTEDIKTPLILTRDNKAGDEGQKAHEEAENVSNEKDLLFPDDASSAAAVNTTKRHRQTPSADLGAILTVLEENEEDDASSGDKSAAKKEDNSSQPQENSFSKLIEDANRATPTLIERPEKPTTKLASRDVEEEVLSSKEDLPTESKEAVLSDIPKSLDPVDSKPTSDKGDIKEPEESGEKETTAAKLGENEKTTDEKVTGEKATEEKATEEKATEEKATEEKATEEKATEEKATKEKATVEKTTEKTVNADEKVQQGSDGQESTKDRPASNDPEEKTAVEK